MNSYRYVSRVARPGLIALVALVAGCAVGPDYIEPETPGAAQASFAGADDAAFSGELPPGEWWRLYDDPVLDAAVREALEANTDLRAAAANLARAEALARGARGERYPSATLQAGSTSGRQNVVAQGLAFEDTIYDAGLSVSYQVDLLGRVRRTIEAADADRGAAAETFASVRLTVAAETARAYAEACGARFELAATRRALDLQRSSLELTERLLEAGRGTRLDVSRAAAAAETTRARLPALEAAHRDALYRLAVLMGRPPAEYPPLAAQCVVPPTLGGEIPIGDGAALLERRPDVRAAERRLAAATARVGVATADMYPNVSIGGSGGWTALDASDLGDGDTSRWSLGPLIQWSFPNRAAARARLGAAQSDVDAALADFDGAWLGALREVESALAAYAGELERVEALGSARTHAADAAELASVRFDAGQISFLDVLQAELALADAELALASSQSRVTRLEVALFLALGGRF